MAEASRARSAGGLVSALRRLGRGLQLLPRPAGGLLALAWMALIWQLSDLPSGDEPRILWGAWLSNCAHAPLFGLLALWCVVALPRADGWPRLGPRALAAILLLVLAYGVVDELHQGTTPGRHPSAFDVLTDLVGAACSLWLAGHVGSRGATARSTGLRLVAGLALCALAGLVATLA